MKKVLLTLSLMVITMTMMAVPAKRGVWKTLKLQDGTEVRATLVGDEHGHFWKAENGQAYALQGDAYVAVDAQQIIQKAKARRAKVNAQRVQRRTFGHPSSFLGKKKAIMILVNFKDVKYQNGHDNALFQKIANQENYNEGKFKGSMADYFKAQSRGKFELDFDVVGPVTVSKNASYYGENDDDDQDKYPGEMVCEAVKKAKEEVADWTPYDWDNDGYVDQVYVVFAGMGEADGGDEGTIWPHAFDLFYAQSRGDGDGPVTVGTNLKVNSYACGPELNGQTEEINGIGTMCHEYSHCLGYPDFYDIDYSGGQGMGSWDLMDAGSYNGDGYQPAGYTGYERWFAGWEEPVELKAEDVEVRNMKSLQKDGEFYIIYNDNNPNEYYMLENRQLEGWDASVPYAGLLILHCDFDQEVWEQNAPNDDPDHQRFTVVPADGEYSYFTYQGTKNYDPAEPFPWNNVNAFNKSFKTKDNQARKAAKFFTKTGNGTYWMNGSVENITQNDDNTIDFNFVANYSGNSDYLFYESFDQCDGTGGNDGTFSGNVGTVNKFKTDNSGWTANGDKYYGCDCCAKFGTNSVKGEVTSPSFAVDGTGTMSFMAAPFGTDGTTLNLSVSNGTISPATVTMKAGEFTNFTATITATGNVKVTFTPAKRLFLDEVLVVDPNATGIQTVSSYKAMTTTRIYTIDGRYVGTNPDQLPRGLYIVNGKKIVK